eukprot:gene7565-15511_t
MSGQGKLSSLIFLTVGCLFGIWIGIIISERRFLLNKSLVKPYKGFHRKSSSEKAFTLCITLKFKDVEQKEIFRKILTPTINYVAKNEFETLSYELMDSETDPLQSFLLERYESKYAFTDIHRKGAIFLEQKRMMKEYNLNAENGFIIDGHGFGNNIAEQQFTQSFDGDISGKLLSNPRSRGLDYAAANIYLKSQFHFSRNTRNVKGFNFNPFFAST